MANKYKGKDPKLYRDLKLQISSEPLPSPAYALPIQISLVRRATQKPENVNANNLSEAMQSFAVINVRLTKINL